MDFVSLVRLHFWPRKIAQKQAPSLPLSVAGRVVEMETARESKNKSTGEDFVVYDRLFKEEQRTNRGDAAESGLSKKAIF